MPPTEDDNSHHSGTSEFKSDHRRFRRQYDPDDVDISKLFIAIREHNTKKIAKLIPKVKNINDIDRNDDGNAPLHVAVKKRYADVVKLLLKNTNVNLNIQNERGDTPLHFAVAARDKELVDTLLGKGADSSLENYEGDTPLDIAERTQKTDIVNSLKTHLSSLQLTPTDTRSRQEIEDRMSDYVKGYVAIYSTYMDDYYNILEKKLQKPGKWCEFVGDITATLSGGNEFYGQNQHKAISMLSLSVIQNVVSSTSTWWKRKQLKKLIPQLILHKKNTKEMNRILVNSAVDIFESYEAQFSQATADNSWERAISKLADDGACRTLNYFKDNPDEEFSVFNVKKGVVLGTSKTYKTGFMKAPKLSAGHTVKNKYLKSWNTADLYEKVGVVVKTHGVPDEYYTKSKDSKSFGYRLHLDVDNLNVFTKEKTPSGEPYEYVLDLDKSAKERLQHKLFKEIDESNGNIAETLRESLETIREEAEKDVDQLENTIAEHFDELMDYVSQNHVELGHSLRELNEQFARGHSEIIHKIDELQEMISQKGPKLQPVKDVFFDLREPSKSFSGRNEQLTDIHNILQDPSYKILVISGLRGVGKTALALKFLDDFSKIFDNNVLWINAPNEETLKKSVYELAKKLNRKTVDQDDQQKNLKLMMSEIYEYFTKRRSKCVVVFDSAEKYERLQDVLPMNFPSDVIEPKIIITSTKSDWENERDHIKVYPLKNLEKTESVKFIKDGLNLKADNSQDEDIGNLAELLNNFPITLQEAVSYIIEENRKLADLSIPHRYTVADHINLYKTRTKQLLSSNILQKYKKDYDKNTYTCLDMSLSKIKSEKIGPQTLKILNILSYFSSDYVPTSLFLKIADVSQLSSIVRLLKDYSIAEVDEKGIAIHGLFKPILKIDLETDRENAKRCLEEALNLLKYVMSDRETAKIYSSHIVSVWNYASKYHELIEEFIVKDLDVARSKFMHFIVEGSDDETFERIISEIKKSRSENSKAIANVQDKNGWTPLHLAAKNGRYMIVKILIDNEAVIDATTEFEFTPLHLAAKNGYGDIVSLLVGAGADLNAKNRHEHTPLHFAVKNNHLNVVEYLLGRKGIDIEAEDIKGFTPLHFAVKLGHLSIVETLLSNGAKVNVETREKRFSPLHFAALRGDLQIVQALLERQAAVDATDSKDYTPLHFATKNDHYNVVEALLRKSASVNAKTIYWWAALHFAVRTGNARTVALLLKSDANVNISNKDGFTPLHEAARANHKDIVDMLLRRPGVDVNLETSKGNTALHLAAEKGNLDIVKALLSNGASDAIVNDEGKLAKDMAGDKETYSYIIRHDRGPSSHLRYNKRKGTAGISGQLYEIMLSMYYVLEGLNRKENNHIRQFYLASNHDAAEIFDDVVFKYVYGDNSARLKFKTSFIQAKHKDNPENPRDKITFTRLFPDTDSKQAFSLKDYLASYLIIKRRIENRELDDDPIFDTRLEDCEFVIYTNALAHRSFDENQKNVEKVPIERDHFLNLGATQHYYRLRLGDNEETKREIIDGLRVAADSVKLSKVLVKSVFLKNIPEITNLDIVKKYHLALSEKVIERTKWNAGKFRDSFIEGELSDGEQIFRKTFFEEMRRLKEFSNMPEEDLKFALRNKDLKLSDNFGKREQEDFHELPSDFVDATVVEGFFKQLKLFIGQVSESDLSEIIKQKIQFLYKVERSDVDSVFAAIEYKMRNWWKVDDKFITEGNKFFQESARISYRFDVREHVGLFTGRWRNLQELHAALREEGKVVVVWGLGGVGKTELVRRYISTHDKDYDGNFIWINAENYNTFVESFTRLAREHLNINTKDEKGKEHDIQFIVKEVYRFFSKRQSLFIFDNAARLASYKEHDDGIDRFLPQGPNKPRMIITSRDSDWGGFEKLNLNVFEEDEARQFIRSAVTEKIYRESDAKALASELQYFPLALAAATAYIRIQNEESKQFTISDYVEKYKTKAKELLNVKLDHDYTDTVFNTWAVTVERIRDETCGEEALKILDSIAYFAPDNIPLDLALNLIDGEKPERKLRTATKLLDQYSMIHRDSGVMNIHRLIQQVTRIYLEEQKRELDVLDSTLKAVTTNFDDKTYTSHAITAWQSSIAYDELIATYSNLPGRIIEGLDKTVRFEEGFTFGKSNTDLLKQKLGLDNPDTLTALHNFGVVLDSKGKYQDAYEIFNEVYLHRLKIYSYKNKDTLSTRNYMALELLKLGLHDKAFSIFDEVYKQREGLLGPDDPDTLNSRGGRALVLSHQGKYREAYKEYSEIYDRQLKSSGGEETQQALTTLNDMAVVLEKQGEYQKAIELYRRICKIREDLLGSDHPSVLINRNNLAYALLKKEEYEESLNIYKDIIERIQQVLGPEHPLALGTRNNMAIALEKLGRYEESIQTYREVYKKISETLSPEHPYALMTQNNIAGVLGTLNKHEEALEVYENVYDKQVVKLGETHRSSLSTLNNIAYSYEKLGNHDEALRKYNEVIENSMVELEEDHPDILETKINIASVYFNRKMYDVALEILQETYKKFQSKGATLSSSASICRKKLGDTLKILDRRAEAFQLYSAFYETTRVQRPDSLQVSRAWKEMETILNDGDVNDLRRNGEGLLHWAVKNNFSDVVKILLEKGVEVDGLDSDGKKAIELAEDRNIKRLLTVASCVAGSRGGRSKREARDCEMNYEDEKVVIKLDEGRDGKFPNWLRGGKYSQLINLADDRRTNKFKETVERINNNEKVMAHLNRVGIVSGIAMHGMMAKNAVADLLNGDYAGVAVNLGFIAGSQGFYRVARATSMKGVDMVSQGRLLLGRSLQFASPFLARGTSAFVTYDLVNQIKSYREGNEDALVGIIGDGIYIGVDIAEIGVEVAEVFSVLEGVSSITGPVGAAIGAVVFVGTDVYSAIRRVSIINREVPLSFGERFVEGVRAFIGLHPGRLIEELLERKDLNNRLLANALQNLKRHRDIRRYVLPIGKLAKTCQNTPESKRICIAGGFGGCPRTRIVTRNVEKCKIEFTSESNSTALFDQEIDDLSWDRSVPDVPESSEMFCFDKGERGSTPARRSYLCENAMGITDLDPNKIDGYTLINLEDGDDTARGFDDSPNLFVVGNGMKSYHGGDSNDTFLLSGHSTLGSLFGGNGVDTLDLTAFAPEEDWVETRFDEGRILLRDSQLAFHGIEKFLGRKSGGDKVYVTCVEYVDGQGGGNGEGVEDHIYLLDGNCTYNIDVILPKNTVIRNDATNGSFHYNIPYSVNGKSQVTTLSAKADNSFFFQYSVTDITSMKTVGNTTSFALAENFNVTISGARSYNYRFKDAEIRTDTKGSSYVLGRSSETVNSIITAYSHLAARLVNASFVVHAVEPNEIIAIGNGNHIMTNDPSHTSHLIGNRGENIFAINPVDNSRSDVDIYNFNEEHSINTLDLRKLNATGVKMGSYGNDLLLTASGLTVKLKNGTEWYGDVHVVLGDNPMKISLGNNGYYLTPQALVFDESKEIILISDRDVEENTEIITPRGGGAITFARNGNQLVLTNVFDGGVGDICTIILSDFYTSRGKMSTLCIKFAEREICLKDHAEEIDNARNIEVLKKEYNENNEHLRTRRMIKHIETPEADENDNNPTITNNKDDSNNYDPPPLTNGATTQSSIITDALNWMKTKATSFLTDIFNRTPPGVDSTRKAHMQHVDPSLFDLNGTLLLVDVFLAKKTGRKIYVPRPDSKYSDSLTLAFNLWGLFEDSVIKSAQMAGIHEEELNIDYFVMKDVVEVLTLCIERGKCDNIAKVLEMFAIEVCPVAGNDGFVTNFNKLVGQSVKDIVNCGSNDFKENMYKSNNHGNFNTLNCLNCDYRQYYLE